MRAASQYSEEFKQAAIQKTLLRGNRTFDDIHRELGVPKGTLATWVYARDKNSVMNLKSSLKKGAPSGKSASEWSVEEKFRVVLESAGLESNEQALGDFLRREGLHSAQLTQWKQELLFAAQEYKKVGRPKKDPEQLKLEQKVHALEKELRRKDKALAETAALLVLKKKAQLLGLIDQDDEEENL